jgi:hypothetical protein
MMNPNRQTLQGILRPWGLAIHRQRDRRNLSEAELWKCMQWRDKRKERGGDQGRDGGKFQPKASNEANGKSAEQTAQTLGISARKVEQMRIVIDHKRKERDATHEMV